MISFHTLKSRRLGLSIALPKNLYYRVDSAQMKTLRGVMFVCFWLVAFCSEMVNGTTTKHDLYLKKAQKSIWGSETLFYLDTFFQNKICE
jgi:hypothetical protein